MGALAQDLRYSLRQLRKNPGFAFTSIIILGLGICASVAIDVRSTGANRDRTGDVLLVKRPRVRAKDGSGEVPPPSYQHFVSRDSLAGVVLQRMFAGVSTRRYRRLQEPVGSEVETTASLVRSTRSYHSIAASMSAREVRHG